MKKLFLAIAISLIAPVIAEPQNQTANLFYVATAVDSTGLESAFSNEASAVVTPQHNIVDLSWTASTSTVAGYNLYRGKVSGGPYAKINTAIISGTTFTDTFTFPSPPTTLKTVVP